MMENKNIKSRGLPGGPNEVFEYITGVFSTDGYKRNSPDVNNPFNIIKGNQDGTSITMQDVDFPVLGIDTLGNQQVMMPENNYQFSGDKVFEIPMAKNGGYTVEEYDEGGPINKWGFLNSGKEQNEIVFGAGLNFPSGTGINAIGVVPKNYDPVFKGVGSFGVNQRIGNFNIGSKADIPILNNNERNRVLPSLSAEWKKSLSDFDFTAKIESPLSKNTFLNKGFDTSASVIYNIPPNKKKSKGKMLANGGYVVEELPKAQNGYEESVQEKTKNEPKAYLGDLFVSDIDLEKLNSTPDLNINQLPEELQQKKQQVYYDGKDQHMSYAEIATHYDGTVPWNMLHEDEKQYANKYYCTTKNGCLASSYNAYDATVGQKYPSNEFLSEAKLKKSLGLQSASKEKLGYPYYDNDGVLMSYEDIDVNGNISGSPVSEKTKNWIESIPYFKNVRQGETNFDLSADSWDTHGLMVEKGGKNIFTSLDSDIINKTNKFANLSEKEKQKIYAQMTPGTVVSFTSPIDAKRDNLRIGLNDKYSLGNSSHSAQVVGYAEDGVPIIFDYGVYRRLDDDRAAPVYGTMKTLSNITIPKAHIGHNLEWAKKNNYFNKEGPGELDLDLSPLYEVKDADVDELEPFYNALKTNKRSLMDDLNIKVKDYDMIAKTLVGITMEETEGGSGWQHNIENKMFGVGQDSVGLTQLMWSNIENDPKLKKVAGKYGITKKSDLKDPDKSAIASMIYGHRNFVSAKENYKKGKKPSIRTYKASDSWKTDLKQYAGKNPVYDGYTFRTEEDVNVDFFTGSGDRWNPFGGIGMDKSIENIQAQFDAIKDKNGRSVKGKYTVREVDGEYVVDKKTLGNGRRNPETGELEDLTDSEIFSYNWNSPYSLTTGDAQGGTAYVKNIQSIGELIQKKVGGEVAYNKSIIKKFNPEGTKELKLYKNYFNGTMQSEKARKNYDKLNRIYYKDAKANKMSSPNYILTHIITT